jgi:hypothetical protein
MHACFNCGRVCDCDGEDHDQEQPEDCTCPCVGKDDVPWEEDT